MLKEFDTPVFILAGGFGTRISEETIKKPKPMVEIGGIPIILHIINYYMRFDSGNLLFALDISIKL